MKLRTKITIKSIKNHFSYSWWQYVLAVALSLFFWNMFFIQTAYRPPENKKIEVYIQANNTDQEKIDDFLKTIWESTVPDMEAVHSFLLANLNDQGYVSSMQLMAYFAAQEGDIYILSNDDFRRFASQGAFMALDDMADEFPRELDKDYLRKGIVSKSLEDENGNIVSETKLFGIPCEKLTVLRDELDLEINNMYLCISISNKNEENVILFFFELLNSSIVR